MGTGFAGALDAAHRQTWIIHSVTKAHNAFFDLTAVMISWLISRGVVVDTTMNKPVPDIETFLSSSSSTSECQGSGPLFVAGRAGTGKLEEGVPLRGANMAAIIGAVCVKAGLLRVGGYALRHEVGNRMTIMLGAEAAKGALGHGILRDVTRRHYTHDTANVNWTALAMEENLPTNIKDNLERSNRFYLQ
ncbi:unnamed protein product [Tilletia controversa]|uniref:Uncharacterized protein n=1 Tax=Tilletia controversa TaxID=13291 RepID=A0A8X7MM48_9BASI|nr:hypothetical protein A4X06_0g7314 [Tilletia controversa]CAD6896903.1 unnamed protein product [Tilletia controversa]